MEDLAAQQGITDFIKAAYSGPNTYLFVALNIIALILHRTGGVSAGWAFGSAACVGGFLGGIGTLIGIEAKVGVQAPLVLMHAVLVGMIVGTASSFIIAYGLALMANRLGLPTIAELLRRNGKRYDLLDHSDRKNGADDAPKPPTGGAMS